MRRDYSTIYICHIICSVEVISYKDYRAKKNVVSL